MSSVVTIARDDSTLPDVPVEELVARFDEWPAGARHDARARLAVLTAGRDRVTVRLSRRGRYLRIRDLATGLMVCVYVPGGH